MYDRRPTARNRLLDLERELLARGRSRRTRKAAKHSGGSARSGQYRGGQQNRQTTISHSPLPIPDNAKKFDRITPKAIEGNSRLTESVWEWEPKALPPGRISSDRASNNSLLDLERQLRAKQQQFQPQRLSLTFQKRARKQLPKTPRLSFTAYVFDTGDPIVVEYLSDRQANRLPPSHLPQLRLAPKLEPEIVTSLSNDGDRNGARIAQTSLTHQNGHRSTLEAIEPELNFPEAISQSLGKAEIEASPSENNSHQNGFHAAFGDIGDEMKYATSFDLGEVQVEIPFDEFDREMEREQSLAKAQTLEERFDEFDRDINLGESSTKTDRSPPIDIHTKLPSEGLSKERHEEIKRSRGEEKITTMNATPSQNSQLTMGKREPKTGNHSLSLTSIETAEEIALSSIEPIAVEGCSLETLPSGSLVEQGSLEPMVSLSSALVAYLPAIGGFLVDTLVFLAALSRIFLSTLAIAICFVTRTSAKASQKEDDPLANPWGEKAIVTFSPAGNIPTTLPRLI